MVEIGNCFLKLQAGEIPVKCLSQKHNRMVRVGFEPRPCRSHLQCFEPLDYAGKNFLGTVTLLEQ